MDGEDLERKLQEAIRHKKCNKIVYSIIEDIFNFVKGEYEISEEMQEVYASQIYLALLCAYHRGYENGMIHGMEVILGHGLEE